VTAPATVPQVELPEAYKAVKARIEDRFRSRVMALIPLRTLIGQIAGDFFAELRAIKADQKREGRPVGQGGGWVWSLADHRRFIAAARASTNLPDGWSFGTALVIAVKRREELLATGMDAEEIHRALYWDTVSATTAEREREARDRDEAARTRARDRESAVREQYEIAMIREEGRARAKRAVEARQDDDAQPRRRRAAS
jgi:hypothetical protein